VREVGDVHPAAAAGAHITHSGVLSVADLAGSDGARTADIGRELSSSDDYRP
jgi:hypothetical protein